MKVYICCSVYYDYCNQWETVELVTADKNFAIKWVKDFKNSKLEWRKYTEWEVDHIAPKQCSTEQEIR